MKFGAKLTILIISIVIGFAVIVSFLVYFSNLRMLEDEIAGNLEFKVDTAIDMVDRFMYEREIDLRSFSVRLALILGGPNPERIKQDLINYRNENKSYVSLSYFDLDGVRIADTSGVDVGGKNSVFIKSKYWKGLLEGESSVAQLVEYSYSLRIPVIFFAHPVYVEGKMTGILVARVATAKLYEITRLPMGMGKDAGNIKIDLIDKEGILLYSNYNRSGILKDKIRHYVITKDVLSKSNVNIGKCKIHNKDFEAVAVEKGYLDFSGNGWALILAIPAKVVFSPADRLKNKMIGLFLVSIIFVVLISLFFAHSFSQPIIKLSQAAVQISRGNFNVKVKAGSRDEIGLLADSFNTMVEGLKKVRGELISAKDYTDTIISSMIDSLIVISPVATIKSVNKATCDLLGYPEDELIGQPIKKIFMQEEEEEEETLHKYFQKIIDDGIMHNIGLTFITKQGKKIPVNFSGSLMRSADKIIGVVGVARDMRQIMAIINDLENKERALKKYSEELVRMQRAMLHIMDDVQESARIKTQFTGMVSHELRTPLASIREGISLVLDKITGDINNQQEKFLTIAKNNVDRLDRLIVAVLDFHKLESGKMEYKIESNDINEIIKGMQNSMMPLFNKKGLSFELQLSDNLPRVQCDHDKIIEVLTNLVNNAYKFTEQGGVTISTSKGDDFIQVAVSDTGIGIKNEDIPKLFQEFTQAHKGRGGTGLGLFICKKIIEAHKGRIWAESFSDGEAHLPVSKASELGSGAVFYFILPVKEQEA